MFAQPWAWLGLAGLAVPVFIHLLARHQAVRARFPSLKFIDATDVSFIKRQRLTDIPLLLVRAALLAAAIVAFAGPRWSTNSANGMTTATMAIVVDATSGTAGEALSAARSEAKAASASQIVESESLRSSIASASAWLAAQTGRRELVVVSDFQRGSVDADAFAAVPAGVGIRFNTLAMTPPKLPAGFELRGDRSRMAWPASAAIALTLPLTVKAGSDQARADAMLSAVASLANAQSANAHARHATVVFPNAPERASLASAAPIDQPWMFAVVQPLLKDAALRSHASAKSLNGELIILVDDEPSSTVSAAITSSVLSSLLQPLAWSEFEPSTIAPEQLKSWERAPSASPSVNNGEPQGRWLWIVVLLLIGVETWMRRRTPSAAPASSSKEAHARVA